MWDVSVLHICPSAYFEQLSQAEPCAGTRGGTGWEHTPAVSSLQSSGGNMEDLRPDPGKAHTGD